MRFIKKTLYILKDDYYIHCDHGSIIVRKDDEELTRISAESIEQIVLFARCSISDFLVKFCNEYHIVLTFVSTYGKFYGRIIGGNTGNVLLREKQFTLDSAKRICLVRDILLGKLVNERNVLLRSAKDAYDSDIDILYSGADKIKEQIIQLKSADSVESLRGIEGAAASIYFACFDNMLKTNTVDMKFIRRSRRPPENNCNALLSLLYMLFTIDCESALENCGLDSYYGYLHALRSGRASLACDLMEEFRACFIDKFVITLINRRQVSPDDFERKQEGIKLKDKSIKNVLSLWENYKNSETEYPLDRKKYERKVIPYLQAQLMAQFIRGDIDEYPPFTWR